MEELIDKTIACAECGDTFPFSAGEQQYYKDQGFTQEPKRCRPCRDEKRVRLQNPRDTLIECSKCGRQATVPFVPVGNRPVYCLRCFQQQKEQ